MIVDYAFLAENADSNQSTGAFYVHGGGLMHFAAQSLPSFLPHITILARVVMSPEEASAEHSYRVSGLDPDGERFCPDVFLTLQKQEPYALDPTREKQFVAVTKYSGIQLAKYGRYIFKIYVDENELKTVHFYCDKVTSDSGIPTS